MSRPRVYFTDSERRAAHCARNNRYNRKRYAKRRADGLCVQCSKPSGGTVRCRACNTAHNPSDGVFGGATHAKRERTDLGLALLSACAVPGTCYTLEEIAAWAGCSRERIRQIEDKAIRKMRFRLMQITDPDVREGVLELLAKKGAAAA